MVANPTHLATLATLILALLLPFFRAGRAARGAAPVEDDPLLMILKSWLRTVLLCVGGAVVIPFSPLGGVALIWGAALFGEGAASTSFMVWIYAIPLGGAALGVLGSALWELGLLWSGRARGRD